MFTVNLSIVSLSVQRSFNQLLNWNIRADDKTNKTQRLY